MYHKKTQKKPKGIIAKVTPCQELFSLFFLQVGYLGSQLSVADVCHRPSQTQSK